MDTSNVAFTQPPVVELVMGITLQPGFFSGNDYVTIYDLLKEKYPIIEEHPQILTIIESVEGQAKHNIPQSTESRKQYISKNGDRLVQIQNDRVVFNWRKYTNQSVVEYPKYDTVRDEFISVLTAISSQYNIIPAIIQHEITFYDHLDLKSLDLTVATMFSALSIFNINHIPKFAQFKIQIPVESLNAVQSFNCTSGSKTESHEPIIVLESTNRGHTTPDLKSIIDWFNASHNSLVEFFVTILSEHTKTKLGYTNNS